MRSAVVAAAAAAAAAAALAGACTCCCYNSHTNLVSCHVIINQWHDRDSRVATRHESLLFGPVDPMTTRTGRYNVSSCLHDFGFIS
jgi:hypothetical protein